MAYYPSHLNCPGATHSTTPLLSILMNLTFTCHDGASFLNRFRLEHAHHNTVNLVCQ